jgi:predicted helicase
MYRPYIKNFIYLDYIAIDIVGQQLEVFPTNNHPNLIIFTSGNPHSKPFQAYCSKNVFSFDCLEKTNGFALYRYTEDGNRHENITDWALQQFQQHYCHSVGNSITKAQIFYYVYAVLHAPAYRAAYEINLKRDFPRIPYYADFQHYAQVGQQLADLHIGYETVAAYPLQRVETPKPNFVPKAKLKADKTNHCIEIDEITKLCGVPEAAWDYKLGNRSALEWVLDQYKESKPSDPTIAAQFNTYRFSDYKEEVIALLGKVCRVSVETMKLIECL